ncbi:MAG TPA: PAS domain-containing protein [Hyphomicrobiaceae bacterium]|nr:PAS domain-containing protein [Hyphomicrobiaceae bacterium]
MRQRTSQILYAYWNETRRGRLAPRRFDIEPARLAGILAETLILERVSATNYPFRLAGTRICEQFQAEFRGSNFLDLWSAGDRACLVQKLQLIAEQGGAAVIEFEGRAGEGRIAKFEALLLPLFHAQPTVDRFLGSISCFRAPLWLGREPISEVVLERVEVVWPDGRPHSLIDRMDRQSPFLPAERQGRLVRLERRAFRVFDGGRSGGVGRKP